MSVKIMDKAVTRLVCIGDSNVNGYPFNRRDSWVTLLAEMGGLETINEGLNGDTTTGVLARFKTCVIDQNPDIVMVLAGTNDLIMGGAKPDKLITNFRKMTALSLENNIYAIFLIPTRIDAVMAAMEWEDGLDYEGALEMLGVLRSRMLSFGKEFEDGISVFDLQGVYNGGFVDGIHFSLSGHREIANILQKLLLDRM